MDVEYVVAHGVELVTYYFPFVAVFGTFVGLVSTVFALVALVVRFVVLQAADANPVAVVGRFYTAMPRRVLVSSVPARIEFAFGMLVSEWFIAAFAATVAALAAAVAAIAAAEPPVAPDNVCGSTDDALADAVTLGSALVAGVTGGVWFAFTVVGCVLTNGTVFV